MKRYLATAFASLIAIAAGGCSSNEPELLEYTPEEVAQMDEDMGIGADGAPVGDAEFEKID
ncbi:MAG: hypothetical protein AAFU85_17940 [Planctomycetota bacterium]